MYVYELVSVRAPGQADVLSTERHPVASCRAVQCTGGAGAAGVLHQKVQRSRALWQRGPRCGAEDISVARARPRGWQRRLARTDHLEPTAGVWSPAAVTPCQVHRPASLLRPCMWCVLMRPTCLLVSIISRSSRAHHSRRFGSMHWLKWLQRPSMGLHTRWAFSGLQDRFARSLTFAMSV